MNISEWRFFRYAYTYEQNLNTGFNSFPNSFPIVKLLGIACYAIDRRELFSSLYSSIFYLAEFFV